MRPLRKTTLCYCLFLLSLATASYARVRQPPLDVFDKLQHGNGAWAPAIRYHDGWFYIFYGDPDFGISFCHHFDGEETGLIVMGRDYAHLSLKQQNGQLILKQATCYGAERGQPEMTPATMPFDQNEAYLRVGVSAGGRCRFAYSLDGKDYTDIGDAFQAKEGKWIGAKVGIFCVRPEHENDGGYANYDWFRIE